MFLVAKLVPGVAHSAGLFLLQERLLGFAAFHSPRGDRLDASAFLVMMFLVITVVGIVKSRWGFRCCGIKRVSFHRAFHVLLLDPESFGDVLSSQGFATLLEVFAMQSHRFQLFDRRGF